MVFVRLRLLLDRRICLVATTVEIETLTPRLVSTVAWFLSERLDGLLLMLSEFY